jgi:two-component system response regulator YesN
LTVFLLRTLNILPHSAILPPESDWRTGVIDDYFETHIQGGSESELAQLLHLSTRQLSRVLQRDYGMSFRQKRTGARMDYAGFLLRTTKQSIGDVCTSIGYQSEAVFYRNFKAHFGITPQQYRKQNEIP